jgi:hypothetical protein
MSYSGDIVATTDGQGEIVVSTRLEDLLNDVNEATTLLQTATSVPPEVADLVDSFESQLHADAPLQLSADPYLTTMLFAAAFRAEKALRHDNVDQQRRDLRIALEQFRQALRDIVGNRPVAADTPVRDVLAATAATLSLPQRELADLLDVSSRQLQRWLSPDGPTPAGDDESRIRIVAQLVNQLRHAFTGPGVLAWFRAKHPTLAVKPEAWLANPLKYPELLAAAAAARAMTG